MSFIVHLLDSLSPLFQGLLALFLVLLFHLLEGLSFAELLFLDVCGDRINIDAAVVEVESVEQLGDRVLFIDARDLLLCLTYLTAGLGNSKRLELLHFFIQRQQLLLWDINLIVSDKHLILNFAHHLSIQLAHHFVSSHFVLQY